MVFGIQKGKWVTSFPNTYQSYDMIDEFPNRVVGKIENFESFKLESSFQVFWFTCDIDKLERSFQLKIFQLLDLSNCLFQLLACPKSVIKKSLMKNVAHNVVIKQNRKTSALSKFHRLRAIGDNK